MHGTSGGTSDPISKSLPSRAKSNQGNQTQPVYPAKKLVSANDPVIVVPGWKSAACSSVSES